MEIDGHKFWGFIGLLVAITLTAALGLAGFSAVMSIRASGKVEYCYTQYYSPQQMPQAQALYGFRAWRSDSHLGTFPDLPTALAAAKSMNCPLATEK